MPHFIAMAGLHGYLPQFSCSCKDYNTAVDVLAELHHLGKNRRRELKKYSALELNLKRDGNEYCEIVECECDTPEIHKD